MSRDPWSAVEAFVGNPIVALAIGLVLLVIGWRMDSATSSSWFLFAAWILFGISVYRSMGKQPFVPRALLTLLIASVIGLLLYFLEIHTARAASVKSDPSAISTPAPVPTASTETQGPPAPKPSGIRTNILVDTPRSRRALAIARESARPYTGNLHERAAALADEIMERLNRNGWRTNEMPRHGEASQRWIAARSSQFMFFDFERVRDIREEFASLHERDTRLDALIKRIESTAAADPNNELMAPLLPMEIEEIAKSLRTLAARVQQTGPTITTTSRHQSAGPRVVLCYEHFRSEFDHVEAVNSLEPLFLRNDGDDTALSIKVLPTVFENEQIRFNLNKNHLASGEVATLRLYRDAGRVTLVELYIGFVTARVKAVADDSTITNIEERLPVRIEFMDYAKNDYAIRYDIICGAYRLADGGLKMEDIRIELSRDA